MAKQELIRYKDGNSVAGFRPEDHAGLIAVAGETGASNLEVNARVIEETDSITGPARVNGAELGKGATVRRNRKGQEVTVKVTWDRK